MEYRDRFLSGAVDGLRWSADLNDDDEHAQALAAIIRNQLAAWD